MEKSNIKKEWDNETLLEYYAVLFFNLQEGKDVNDEWMDVKKEILQRMEKNIYSTAKYSLQGTTQGNGLTGGLPPVRFSM